MPTFRPDRRALLAAPAILAGAALAPAAQAAAPPQAGTRNPGFHRVKVGEIEVTALLDGAMGGAGEQNIPRFFPDATLESVAALRERAWFMPNGLHQPVGAYVVNNGRNLFMIDCGGHSSFIPTTGRTLDALRASGARPVL